MRQAREPRIRVNRDDRMVYLEIDGEDHPVKPFIAQQLGEALFKTATDVLAKITRDKEGKT